MHKLKNGIRYKKIVFLNRICISKLLYKGNNLRSVKETTSAGNEFQVQIVQGKMNNNRRLFYRKVSEEKRSRIVTSLRTSVKYNNISRKKTNHIQFEITKQTFRYTWQLFKDGTLK